ncbi:methyltransferase family protein [Ectothiorhodospira shaposhnikovii]|uniref:methyltransferase family protein n=1 Tax=Ectothiorhodospira shaposhnikovii TaxID=1054 RepID=UPI003B832F4B
MTLKDSAAWWTKVAAISVLIGLVIERFLAGGLPGWPSPAIPLAQLLVVFGGCITLAHYALLRRKGVTCTEPQDPVRLVRSGGLFPSTRHPMYLGDAVTCVGLVMLAPSVAAGLIFPAVSSPRGREGCQDSRPVLFTRPIAVRIEIHLGAGSPQNPHSLVHCPGA